MSSPTHERRIIHTRSLQTRTKASISPHRRSHRVKSLSCNIVSSFDFFGDDFYACCDGLLILRIAHADNCVFILKGFGLCKDNIRKRRTIGICDNVMLQPQFPSIRCILARFRPPKTARTEAESTINREKSILSLSTVIQYMDLRRPTHAL